MVSGWIPRLAPSTTLLGGAWHAIRRDRLRCEPGRPLCEIIQFWFACPPGRKFWREVSSRVHLSGFASAVSISTVAVLPVIGASFPLLFLRKCEVLKANLHKFAPNWRLAQPFHRGCPFSHGSTSSFFLRNACCDGTSISLRNKIPWQVSACSRDAVGRLIPLSARCALVNRFPSPSSPMVITAVHSRFVPLGPCRTAWGLTNQSSIRSRETGHLKRGLKWPVSQPQTTRFPLKHPAGWMRPIFLGPRLRRK